jgi:mannitol-1-phosphate 5-dehydrogenase
MVKVLIVGAGAIGRGFLPWCLPKDAEITFLEESENLVKNLRERSVYTTYLAEGSKLRARSVSCVRMYSPSELNQDTLGEFDITFIAVGPRNVERLPSYLSRLTCPVFALENDPATVERIREVIDYDSIFFGVPDVIASSTASHENLSDDPYAVHTEDGVLYLSDEGQCAILKCLVRTRWSDRANLEKEWDAKLYLHNTPHCIAAYMGHIHGAKYIHDAMRIESVACIVSGSVHEVLDALRYSNKYPISFLTSYAKKEMSRFKNTLLFDPISRVARQPLRKLRPSPYGRLIGALELCLLAKIFPKHILSGVLAALCYREVDDTDFQAMRLIDSYGMRAFLWHFLGIPSGSIISNLISDAYPKFQREWLND